MSIVVPKAEPFILEGKKHKNLSVAELIELAVQRKEIDLVSGGAIRSTTGEFTGRTPFDKYTVREAIVEGKVDWGKVNQPMPSASFEVLLKEVQRYLKKREIFIFDGYAGSDTNHRLSLRVITQYAWQSLFARQLFIRPTRDELKEHEPEFTVVSLPDLKVDSEILGTRSGTVIAVSYEYQMVIIIGTHYAGEIKKSIFGVMNMFLPDRDVLPMHCSANEGKKGDVSLFFGLSGTGKTTLSADPNRSLIGDDEHGWSGEGIFNFEGGCYAKCIGLSKEKEPQIFEAIKFGTVLENVVLDDARCPDFEDTTLTENTRAAYPIDNIPNAKIPGVAGHPNTIFFLTADAFGVLPPISRLTPQQAMYHFLCGYTSKLAGTELGVTKPTATFSACFGAPFLPRPPHVYADMLGEKISQHDARVFLINTGWTGGPYGVGERIRLRYTRAMITAALCGELEDVTTSQDPIFGLNIPDSCPGVPAELLVPQNTWRNQGDYARKATELAGLFHNHFSLFEKVDEEIKRGGPIIV